MQRCIAMTKGFVRRGVTISHAVVMHDAAKDDVRECKCRFERHW